MKIRYEGVVLEVDPRDWYQRTLLRRRAKRAIDAYPGAGSGFVYHRRLNSVKSAHFATAAIGRASSSPTPNTLGRWPVALEPVSVSRSLERSGERPGTLAYLSAGSRT